jgi:hypothetical protein
MISSRESVVSRSPGIPLLQCGINQHLEHDIFIGNPVEPRFSVDLIEIRFGVLEGGWHFLLTDKPKESRSG